MQIKTLTKSWGASKKKNENDLVTDSTDSDKILLKLFANLQSSFGINLKIVAL